MECDIHSDMIVMSAFSEGQCEKCDGKIITSHIPCNKICGKCSVEYNLCIICGEKINNN